MWVTSGSHPDCSVGQWVKWVNMQVRPTFNPATNTEYLVLAISLNLKPNTMSKICIACIELFVILNTR